MERADDLAFKSGFVSVYIKMLDELELIKATKPHIYDDWATSVNRVRDYVKLMTQVDDLPEVPKK